MGFFCGLINFEIYFGMPDIPHLIFLVNSRCLGQAYVS